MLPELDTPSSLRLESWFADEPNAVECWGRALKQHLGAHDASHDSENHLEYLSGGREETKAIYERMPRRSIEIDLDTRPKGYDNRAVPVRPVSHDTGCYADNVKLGAYFFVSYVSRRTSESWAL